MVKSDQANKTRLSAQQLGFVFEGTLDIPNNSVLKQDIGILEGITRACHLEAGLWPHSVACAATMLNARQMRRFRVWGPLRTISCLQGGVLAVPKNFSLKDQLLLLVKFPAVQALAMLVQISMRSRLSTFNFKHLRMQKQKELIHHVR